jgi:hypothetical protein
MNRTQILRRLAPVVAAAWVSACAAPQPPSAPPTASPPAALAYADQPGDGEILAPGTYAMTSVAPLRIAFTVPSGWYKGTIDWAVWDSDTNASIAFAVPANLYEDPCAADKGLRNPTVGPTVADLVAALGTVPGTSAGPATDVTLAGFAGQRIDLTGDDPAACDDGVLWDVGDVAVPLPGPNEPMTLRVLDAGGTRLIVSSRTPADASPGDVAELQAVIESIRVDRP